MTKMRSNNELFDYIDVPALQSEDPDENVIIKDENGSELLSVDAHISETVEKAALDFIVVNNMPSFKIDIY